jgi:hypothetical protein
LQLSKAASQPQIDEVYEHILHMTDALSEGIVNPFPNTFA